MTIQEFHREFKIAFDKVDSAAYPEFLDGEIDTLLNEAQDRFVKTRYGTNNVYQKGFEQSQKRTDDLKALVKSRFTTLSTSNFYQSTGDNVYEADLSNLFEDEDLTTASTDAYMLYLKSIAKTCLEDCCEYHRVKLVQQDDLSSIANDPFNKPKKDRPVIFFENGNIFIWSEPGTTVDKFMVTFLKRPNQMDLGTYGGTVTECELSEHTHREIVQHAVTIALENIESQRTQSQIAVNTQKIE